MSRIFRQERSEERRLEALKARLSLPLLQQRAFAPIQNARIMRC